MNIKHKGEVYTASETMLPTPDIDVDSIEQNDYADFGEIIELTLFIQDEIDVENFYLLEYIMNDRDFEVIDDENRDDLSAGTYTLTVTAANDCEVVFDLSISDPPLISLQSDSTLVSFLLFL